jgi:hypothetical protein
LIDAVGDIERGSGEGRQIMDMHVRMRERFAGRQVEISGHSVDLQETVHLASVSPG